MHPAKLHTKTYRSIGKNGWDRPVQPYYQSTNKNPNNPNDTFKRHLNS